MADVARIAVDGDRAYKIINKMAARISNIRQMICKNLLDFYETMRNGESKFAIF